MTVLLIKYYASLWIWAGLIWLFDFNRRDPRGVGLESIAAAAQDWGPMTNNSNSSRGGLTKASLRKMKIKMTRIRIEFQTICGARRKG